MDQTALPASGLEDVPVLTRFEGVADSANYQPLPDDWVLATADIVGSTKRSPTAATRPSTWPAPA